MSHNDRSAATGVFHLGAANAIALAAALLAAALYARWLSAEHFAHWASALAVARAALLLLDGGLKAALVRRSTAPGARTMQRLKRLSAAVAGLLTGATALAAWALYGRGQLDDGAAALLVAYPAAYLLPYPSLFSALASMERAQRFRSIGRAEGASVAVEFALPAVLMFSGLPWWLAFALAAVGARLLRSAWICVAARRLLQPVAGPDAGASPRAVLQEGLGLQAVAGLSMLRDQMHLWLLAPWFGASWAGTYTFALTACGVAAQVFVQTTSRVALTELRLAPPPRRWPLVLLKVRSLSITVLPPMAVLPALLTRLDATWWHGEWHLAVALVPWIALRMVAGLWTSLLGVWLVIAQPPWMAALAHARWTLLEIVAAIAAMAMLGPAGLAVSGAVTAGLGAVLFLRAAAPASATLPRLGLLLLHGVVGRPSIWIGLLLAGWLHLQPAALPWSPLVLLAGWCSERVTRRALMRLSSRLAKGLARRWPTAASVEAANATAAKLQ